MVILTGVVEEGERQGRSRAYRKEDSERGSERVVLVRGRVRSVAVMRLGGPGKGKGGPGPSEGQER